MGWKKHLFWLVPLLIADGIGLFIYLRKNTSGPYNGQGDEKTIPPSELQTLVFPTDQSILVETDTENVFQPTAAGRIESALYGSTRSRSSSSGLVASFHEGIDIAAVRRDKRGQPLDNIYAIADGRIAYINRHAGNSNYGKYLVILHDDPAGNVYSLYAHLADIATGISGGQKINAGEIIARMGNTPSGIIPMARAHLHLEIGVIINSHFSKWHREQKLKPYHGNFHGWNLIGIDPIAVFAAHSKNPDNFSLLEHIKTIPVAFEIIIRTDTIPDYFVRYPLLWQGPSFQQPGIVINCSENGVPLSGRNTDQDEDAIIGKSEYLIKSVHTDVLGRNGARLIRQKNSKWLLADNGNKWRTMVLYGAHRVKETKGTWDDGDIQE